MWRHGGLRVSALVFGSSGPDSSLGRVHRVLGSWARHLTLTVPLSTQVYRYVPVNLMLGVTLRLTSIPSRRGVDIFLVASSYRNRDTNIERERDRFNVENMVCYVRNLFLSYFKDFKAGRVFKYLYHLTDLIFPLEVAEVLVQWTLELLLCLEPRVLLGREVPKQVCI